MYQNKFLVRTIPTITSNIKIVSNGTDIFFESFDSNSQLSDVRYKHFKVNPSDPYQYRIKDFWKDTPEDIIYDVPKNTDSSVYFSDFSDQYLPLYWAGASSTEDSFFKEEFEYTAPLYLGDVPPSGFIIFRIDGAGNIELTPSNFSKYITNKWKVVNYFDMNKTTNVGIFLNEIIDDISNPVCPISVSFETKIPSYINGIDVQSGGFVSKSINLAEECEIERGFFDLENYVTTQYKNNSVVHPRILNFKWIFDDTPSTPKSLRKWTLNRYMGFYVDNLKEIESIDLTNNQTTIVGIESGGAIINSSEIDLNLLSNDNTIVLHFLNKYWVLTLQGDELFINADGELNADNKSANYKVGFKTTNYNYDVYSSVMKIYVLQFSEVCDIDMDRVVTSFADFEYNSPNKLSLTEEVKFYYKNNVEADYHSADYEISSGFTYLSEDFRTNPKPIPVASEYVSNLELFTLDNDDTITQIWNRTATVPKYGFTNSNGNRDYPYRLNNNLIAGVYNSSTDIYDNVLSRNLNTLDWFYTMKNKGLWDNSTLHLDNELIELFDIRELGKKKSPGFAYDYYMHGVISQPRKTTTDYYYPNRYSLFSKNIGEDFYSSILKGIKYYVADVVIRTTDKIVLNGDNYTNWKITNLVSSRPKFINNVGVAQPDPYLPSEFINTNDAVYETGIDIIRDFDTNTIMIWVWILQNNKDDSGNFISGVQYPFESSFRDEFYTNSNWIHLLDDGRTRPSANPQDRNYFSPYPLTAAIFLTALNNGSTNYYDTKIRYCDVNNPSLSDSIVYYTEANSTWQLWAENSTSIDIVSNVNKYTKVDVDTTEISYNEKKVTMIVDDPNIFKQDNAISYKTEVDDTKTIETTVYRYPGSYDLIFKTINLWKPTYTPDKKYESWDYNQRDWGKSTEWIWNKTNRNGLKTKNISETNPQFPYIDEFGYQYGKRDLFISSWDANFFYETEKR